MMKCFLDYKKRSVQNFCVFLLFATGACAPRVLKDKSEALRVANAPKNLSDDLGIEDVLEHLELQIKYFESDDAKRFPNLNFGSRVISRAAYAEALNYLLQSSRASSNPSETFFQLLRDNFDFFEVYGGRKWGEVFLTSYYEPELLASRKKAGRFTQALYKTPDDMVEIDLTKFQNLGAEISRKSITARISNQKNAQGQPIILPYFSREEIDIQNTLNGKKLELYWVDPIDAFFLQIQGSGVLVFDDKTRVRVGYAAQNGHKYEALGVYLRDVIPKEKMSAHSIENYLRSLEPAQTQALLAKNPSYVFFKELKESAVTYSGISAFDGRTIATDTRYFPKGAMAVLSFEKPVFESEEAVEAKEFVPVQRIAFDHDKGGAINGGGRVDLFWGRGPLAKQAAGVMKSYGTLYYLAPKEELLKRLPSSEAFQ